MQDWLLEWSIVKHSGRSLSVDGLSSGAGGGGGGGGAGAGEVWSLVLLVPTGKLRFPYFIKIIPTNNHTFIFISIHYIMKNRNSKC